MNFYDVVKFKPETSFLCWMKRVFLFCLLMISLAGFTQEDAQLPPFRRFPTLPPIQLLLGDSATKYTKENIPRKKAVLLMLFSPDCSHCQQFAEEMSEKKEAVKDIHIVMATLHSIAQMNEFVEKYGLKQLNNVVVGRDIYFFIPTFFSVKNLPYLAFYNRKGNLILGFEGSMTLERILQVFKEQ